MSELSSFVRYGATRLAPRIGVEASSIIELFEMPSGSWYLDWYKTKKDGSKRSMSTPCDPLMEIQRAIVSRLYPMVNVSPIAHGCIRKRSIRTCILEHTGARSALCLDLERAFGSVGFIVNKRDFGLERDTDLQVLKFLVERYRPIGYPFSRNEPYIPQGAPTSPGAFNISCRGLDARMFSFARRLGGKISRYVDDIVFSWPSPIMPLRVMNALIGLIEDLVVEWPERHFYVNREKSYIIQQGNRHGVPIRCAGVNLINDRTGLPKADLEHFRMDLYCAYRAGHKGRVDGILGHIINVYGDENVPWRILSLVQKFDDARFQKLLLLD